MCVCLNFCHLHTFNFVYIASVYVHNRACDVRALGPAHVFITGVRFTYVYDLLMYYALDYVVIFLVIIVIVGRNCIMLFHVIYIIIIVY